MATEQQKELFNEFKKKEGGLKKITDRITKKRPQFYLSLPLENLIMAVIALIMAVIVSFALGVERGKRLAGPVRLKKVSAPVKKEGVLPEVTLKPIEMPQVPAAGDNAVFPYTIQLVSFKQKQVAENERKKLLARNIEVFVTSSGNWYQVCAGSYKTVKDAENALKELKKDYKGSFVRNK